MKHKPAAFIILTLFLACAKIGAGGFAAGLWNLEISASDSFEIMKLGHFETSINSIFYGTAEFNQRFEYKGENHSALITNCRANGASWADYQRAQHAVKCQFYGEAINYLESAISNAKHEYNPFVEAVSIISLVKCFPYASNYDQAPNIQSGYISRLRELYPSLRDAEKFTVLAQLPWQIPETADAERLSLLFFGSKSRAYSQSVALNKQRPYEHGEIDETIPAPIERSKKTNRILVGSYKPEMFVSMAEEYNRKGDFELAQQAFIQAMHMEQRSLYPSNKMAVYATKCARISLIGRHPLVALYWTGYGIGAWTRDFLDEVNSELVNWQESSFHHQW